MMMTPKDYLDRPYARRLVPDESGGYVASIQEFPGCVAEGDSAAEAVSNLEAAASSWIEAALGLGQAIPEPVQTHGYSGKVMLRMPRGLHKRVAEAALSEGTSLNQLLVTAAAIYVGSHSFSGARAHLTKASVTQQTTENYFIGGQFVLHLGENKFVNQVSTDRAFPSGINLIRLAAQ